MAAGANDASDSLRSAYAEMANRFLSKGLDTCSIDALRHKYTGQPGKLEPIPYANFPSPLGDNMVRLIVIPLAKASSQLVDVVGRLSQGIQAAMPQGTEIYVNKPERWHITLFHTSKFDDPRPAPLKSAAPGLLETAPGQRPLPTSQQLQEEQQKLQEVVSHIQPVKLEVHRVLLADSGTLLVCLTDPHGSLANLRQDLRAAFPGAPTRQTQIIHVSVLRVLTARQLSAEDRKELQAVCDDYTEKLQGMQVTATELWYIWESIFSNIEGQVHPLHTG